VEAVIAAFVALNTTQGAGTVYAEPYIGRELFCSTLDTPLRYDDLSPLWVALPYSQYKVTWNCGVPYSQYKVTWNCGDLILIREHLDDDTTRSLMVLALDTGPFGGNCVAQGDGECLSIVVDVPQMHATWDTLSARVEVINLSAVARMCRDRGMCD
jgi:hypothetical protein